MRTDTGQIFKLEDYRPSDWLIPETRLTFRLPARKPPFPQSLRSSGAATAELCRWCSTATG
jgi:hypothetical protein